MTKCRPSVLTILKWNSKCHCKKHKACVPLILCIEIKRSSVNFLYVTILFVANILQASKWTRYLWLGVCFWPIDLRLPYAFLVTDSPDPWKKCFSKSWQYEVPQKFLQTKNPENVQNIVNFPILSSYADILSVSVITVIKPKIITLGQKKQKAM